MSTKKVIVNINDDGFDLDPENLTIVKDEGFKLVSKWEVPTNVTKLKISIVEVLWYDSSNKSYAPDLLATIDWKAHRFTQRSLKPSKPEFHIDRRGLNNPDSDHPNNAHRLIKLKATVYFKNGPPTVVDPIIDERPT
jgi:hypothetical protein